MAPRRERDTTNAGKDQGRSSVAGGASMASPRDPCRLPPPAEPLPHKKRHRRHQPPDHPPLHAPRSRLARRSRHPGPLPPANTHCQPGPRRPPALPTPRLQRPPRQARPPAAHLATRPSSRTRRRAAPSCRRFIAPPSRHGPKSRRSSPGAGNTKTTTPTQFDKPHPAHRPHHPPTANSHADAHPMPP